MCLLRANEGNRRLPWLSDGWSTEKSCVSLPAKKTRLGGSLRCLCLMMGLLVLVLCFGLVPIPVPKSPGRRLLD